MGATALMGVTALMGTVGQTAMRVQTVRQVRTLRQVQACLRQQHAAGLKQRPAHRTGLLTSRCLHQHSRSSSSSSAQPAATLQLTASSRGSWQLASCKGACRRLLLLLLECRSSSTHAGACAAQRHNSCLQHLQHGVSMQRLAAMQAAPRRVHVLSNGAG